MDWDGDKAAGFSHCRGKKAGMHGNVEIRSGINLFRLLMFLLLTYLGVFYVQYPLHNALIRIASLRQNFRKHKIVFHAPDIFSLHN